MVRHGRATRMHEEKVLLGVSCARITSASRLRGPGSIEPYELIIPRYILHTYIWTDFVYTYSLRLLCHGWPIHIVSGDGLGKHLGRSEFVARNVSDESIFIRCKENWVNTIGRIEGKIFVILFINATFEIFRGTGKNQLVPNRVADDFTF